MAWYPFQHSLHIFGQVTTNINGELIVSGTPLSRYLLTPVGKTGATPSSEFEFGEEGTEKQIEIVLQKGTKLHGNVARADGAVMHGFRFFVWEIRDDLEKRVLRNPLLTRNPPDPFGPYQILLPPGNYEIEVRCNLAHTRSRYIGFPEGDAGVFEHKQTLIIDGTQDEIELDIVLEEVGRE